MKSFLGDSEIELTGNSVFVSFRFVFFFLFLKVSMSYSCRNCVILLFHVIIFFFFLNC